MARRVFECMTPDLLAIPHSATAGVVLGRLLAHGLTAAPIVDDRGRPIGVISLREVAQAPERSAAIERMRRPVTTIGPHASVEDAADRLAQTGLHHLVVVDDAGVAVGFVGAIDVLRALRGFPTPHPHGLRTAQAPRE